MNFVVGVFVGGRGAGRIGVALCSGIVDIDVGINDGAN